jgi:hypothetical protein
MALKYIMDKVAADLGIEQDDASERAVLVDKINEAARDLYSRPDVPISLMECYVRATANKEIALPPFVGELRAIRPGCKDFCSDKWELHTMFPRYNRVEWVNIWKNWRVKGYVPVAIEWTNTAPGTIIYPEIDTDLIITIIGSTDNSNRATDSITMTTASKVWTKSFNNILKISKNKLTTYDVILEDAEGDECAIIYADQLEARYMLADVSEFPNWQCNCEDGTSVMEILYKPILPVMKEDTDFFPVDGFDDVLVIMTKMLYTELEEGKEQRAILMGEKARQLTNQFTQNKTGNIPKRLAFRGRKFIDHSGDGGFYR